MDAPRPRYVPAAFPRLCSCCREPITLEQWLALPYDGDSEPYVDERGCKLVVEMRTHSCGSTLGAERLVELEANQADAGARP